MHLVEFLVVLAVLAAAVWVISAPLRAEQPPEGEDRAGEGERSSDVARLEAAKEAKYREIRDAELDFRTGKLSEEDYRALDAELRAEAVAILRELDAAHAADEKSGPGHQAQD